jgi:predicted transcriptional regulator of viral defense system
MTRSSPPSLAPLIEQLELDRPDAVSVAQVADIIARTKMTTPPRLAIQRLAQRGWLLRTGVRGVWEFAPAERAGAISSHDPLLPLQAALLASANRGGHERARDQMHDDTHKAANGPAVALGSALWLHDLVDRAPQTPEVAVPPRAAVSNALDRLCRVIRFRANLPPVRKHGLPVHSPATVLVHLAHRPSDVRSWASVLDNLSRIIGAADETDVLAELKDRPNATRVRLAYLLSGVAPALADRLNAVPTGKVWFGPRRRLRRHDARLNIADTMLPISPADLEPAAVRK